MHVPRRLVGEVAALRLPHLEVPLRRIEGVQAVGGRGDHRGGAAALDHIDHAGGHQRRQGGTGNRLDEKSLSGSRCSGCTASARGLVVQHAGGGRPGTAAAYVAISVVLQDQAAGIVAVAIVPRYGVHRVRANAVAWGIHVESTSASIVGCSGSGAQIISRCRRSLLQRGG